jgi:hypothetical protein
MAKHATSLQHLALGMNFEVPFVRLNNKNPSYTIISVLSPHEGVKRPITISLIGLLSNLRTLEMPITYTRWIFLFAHSEWINNVVSLPHLRILRVVTTSTAFCPRRSKPEALVAIGRLTKTMMRSTVEVKPKQLAEALFLSRDLTSETVAVLANIEKSFLVSEELNVPLHGKDYKVLVRDEMYTLYTLYSPDVDKPWIEHGCTSGEVMRRYQLPNWESLDSNLARLRNIVRDGEIY